MYRILSCLIFLLIIVSSQFSLFVSAGTIITNSRFGGSRSNNYFKTPVRNYRTPYYQAKQYYNPVPYNGKRIYKRRPVSSFSDINALEKYTLNRNYRHDSDLERLQRLEMQAFGAIQEGDINSRYDNVRSVILSRPKNNYKTSFFRSIGDYFSGQMTGFTPSLGNDPYFSSNSGFSTYPYPSTYGNTNAVQYSGPFGSGYRINNYGTGNYSGVRILD